MNMKTLSGASLIVLVLSPVSSAAIAVGTGSDSSFVVIESPNVGTRSYEVFYTFDVINPLGTDDLLSIIDAADGIISFNFGGSSDNQFLAEITLGGVSESFDGTNYWAQWVAGGEAGVGPAPSFLADPQPVSDITWTFGSGVSAPFRIVEPGSSEVLIFSDGSTPPSFDPLSIPEPAISGFLLSSSLLLLKRRHRG